MAQTFLRETATPEKSLLKEQVTEAQIPGEDGYLGILPGHSPMLSRLKSGVLTYKLANNQHVDLAVHGGFLEVKDDHVRCLVDQAENACDIDLDRANRAQREALNKLNNAPIDLDVGDALAAAMRAEARIEAAKRNGKK